MTWELEEGKGGDGGREKERIRKVAGAGRPAGDGLRRNAPATRPVPHPGAFLPTLPTRRRCGVTIVQPPDAPVAALFRRLGSCVEVNTSEELLALQAVTSLMGPYYELLRQITKWVVGKGERVKWGAGQLE